MADSHTTNFGWTLCEVGASRDTWGQKWNDNLTSIDQHVSMAMPVGAILDFAGTAAPPGWMVADGRLVSRTTYSALFAAIGTAWGAGDGSTNFALPNLIGRAGVGPGTLTDANGNTLSLSFAQKLGNLSNHILLAHLPSGAVGSTDTQGYHAHGGATAPGANHTHTTDAQGSHSHNTAGGAHGHTIHDPGHAHAYDDYTVGGSGYIASLGSPTGYTNVPTPHPTYPATTGIWVDGGDHSHTMDAQGYHAHNVLASGNLQLGIYGDGSHTHTIYLGGSSAWFPVQNPVLVVTKIIYAGSEAVAVVRATLESAPITLEGRDELAALREELEQLRQLVSLTRPPGPPRLLSAPQRGPH